MTQCQYAFVLYFHSLDTCEANWHRQLSSVENYGTQIWVIAIWVVNRSKHSNISNREGGVTYKKSQVHDFNGQGRQKLYLTLKRCPLGKYE